MGARLATSVRNGLLARRPQASEFPGPVCPQVGHERLPLGGLADRIYGRFDQEEDECPLMILLEGSLARRDRFRRLL